MNPAQFSTGYPQFPASFVRGLDQNFAKLFKGTQPYTVTKDYSFLDEDSIDSLQVDATAGNITITLPSPTGNRRRRVIKIDASANTVTLSAGSNLINGAVSVVLSVRYGSVTVEPSGSTWFIVSTSVQALITGGSINGTPIGATTPSTGAFTTLSTTGAVTLSSTLGVTDNITAPSIRLTGYSGSATKGLINFEASGTTDYIYYNANSLAFRLSGSDRMNLTTTGLAVTGSLSATGAILAQSVGAFIYTPNFGTGSGYVQITNTGGTSLFGVDNSAGSDLGYSSYGAGITNPTSITHRIGSTTVAVTTSTGLAVTGALSSTGTVSITGAGSSVAFTSAAAENYIQSANGQNFIGINQASTYIRVAVANTVIGTFASTGFDITGEARCDTFRLDTAPTVSAATASTHKVAVNLNGSTYYFLCTNV